MRTALILLLAVSSLVTLPGRAEEGVSCAKVELVIEQTMTLEREGFEAKLQLNNGLPVALNGFSLTLRFADEAGNPVQATADVNAQTGANILFFHRYLPSGSESAPIPTVGAGASATYKYLIVPTTRAARDAQDQELPNGRLFYVGATIVYTPAGGEQVTVEVVPDSITVRPMPLLALEYFLPGDVYADDPFTPAVSEPPVPFPLGVRVVNRSQAATARKLRIESAQPRITDNQQGLLIDFKIIGSEVNGQPATSTLLANFGDIPPARSAIGSWLMTTTLSGRFTALSGEVSHAPEFGGALTSLIPADAIKTYRLLGRVLVDFPGRDAVPDFIATKNFSAVVDTELRVHESDNDKLGSVETPNPAIVSQFPASFTDSFGVVSAPADSPQFFFYARMSSPIASDKIVTAKRRSDGKILPAGNAWISKTKVSGNWIYSLNIFDCLIGTQSNLGYDLSYADPVVADQPPVIAFARGGTPISDSLLLQKDASFPAVDVAATDDGPVSKLRLEAGALPYGAQLAPTASGLSGALTWPGAGRATGTYPIVFRANDGAQTTRRVLTIQVVDAIGGGYDTWAQSQWPGITDPAVIGFAADPDHDDIPNLMEYALAGNPKVADDAILPIIGKLDLEGQTHLTLTFTQRMDDPQLIVQVAGAGAAFAPPEAWVMQTTPPISSELLTVGGISMRRLTVRDSVPLSDANPRRYLRLVIIR